MSLKKTWFHHGLLEHDPSTGRSSFGLTLAEARKAAPEFTEARIEAELKQYLVTHTDAREVDVINSVVGNTQLIGHRLKKLVREGFAEYTGDGKKTSPRLYNAVRIPLEDANVVAEDAKTVLV